MLFNTVMPLFQFKRHFLFDNPIINNNNNNDIIINNDDDVGCVNSI